MNEKIFLYLLDELEMRKDIEPFYQQVPELEQAEHDCFALMEQVKNTMGYDFFDQLEEKVIKFLDLSVQAYYLLGLGLRQEVLRALLKP